MTQRNRDLARRGTVAHRVVPAQLACRVGARAQARERNAWPAVVSIALGSFALVFSEVIPVGLLADISGHLRVSIGTGGLMVVVPAVAAAVAAPLLTLCSARLERRRVLVGLSALVLVSDVIAGLAPGIGVMLAARAVLGDMRGRVLGVRGRGRDQPGQRAGPGHRGGGGQLGDLPRDRRQLAGGVADRHAHHVAGRVRGRGRLRGDRRGRPARRGAAAGPRRPGPAQVAADGGHAAGLTDRPGGGGRDLLRQLRRLHLHRPAAAHPGPPRRQRDHAGAARVRPGRRGRQLHRRRHRARAPAGHLDGLGPADRGQRAAARDGHRRPPADHRAGGRLGAGLRGGAGGRAELDGPGDAGQPRRRPGPVRVRAARLAGRRLLRSAASIYDAEGPGGVLVLAAAVAAAGSLTLLGRAGAAISSPPAGSADLAANGAGTRRPRRPAQSIEQQTVQRPR